ncbi:APC family permease [Mesoplasma photuris]|uniref:APC family permease n=1 Tax=Mesoplasma photuris TaxID=217731 RepID=UPI0004E181ED|nr:APC family permease [Mesoplasma photuris]
MAKSELIKRFAQRKSYKQDQQISLKQLVWLGFNYTVSMGFTLTLSKTFGGETGVGVHLFWIIMLGAIVAGGAAWAFAKCSNVFSDKNGGAFEYTRRTFGRFNGWMVGFYQYVLIPVTTPASILVMITIAFQGMYDPLMFGSEEKTRLILNIIAIGVYIVLSLLVLLGTVVFKWATNLTSGVKWIILIMVYISSVIIMIRTNGENYNEAIETGELTSQNFNTSFSAFFYAYTGFETFSTISDNVKNPKKTMPKAIMLVLFIATAFYIIGLVFVMGALGGNVSENPNNQIISTAMGGGALVMVGISNIAANINGFMQGAYYSGGMLQPLAEQRMITTKIAEVNKKKNVAIKALFLNMILTVFFAVFWLVLPYILNDDGVDYTSLIGFNSIVTFIIYGYVICAALYLSIKHKTSSNILIYILWGGVLAFLGYQFVAYFIEWDTNKWQILTFSVVTLLSLLWYFFGATLNQRKKYFEYKIRQFDKKLLNCSNEKTIKKFKNKKVFVQEQLDWINNEIVTGKYDINSLPDWKDTNEFKEIKEYKLSKIRTKERSIIDGSSLITTPKFILVSKIKKINKKIMKSGSHTKQIEFDFMTKIEMNEIINSNSN